MVKVKRQLTELFDPQTLEQVKNHILDINIIANKLRYMTESLSNIFEGELPLTLVIDLDHVNADLFSLLGVLETVAKAKENDNQQKATGANSQSING